MLITREVVLEKLNAYLDNRISKEDLYQWTLGAAVSEDFQGLSQSDPMLYGALSAMMKISRKDPAKAPVQGTLEYYKRCLAGEAEFSPSAMGSSAMVTGGTLPAAQPEEESIDFKKILQDFQEWKYFKDTVLTARLYVFIFALCSFVVQISSVVHPGFMQIGLWIPSREEAFADALPLVIYAYLAMIPLRRLTQPRMFIIAFPVFTAGMIFYWKLAFYIVDKLSLNWIFILSLLPFTAIPATLALILLIAERVGYTRVKR